MKEIKEIIKSTSEKSRDAFLEISNKTKNGFHIFSIKDLTFNHKYEILIEYDAMDLFLKTINKLWKLHKKINKGE